MNRQQKLSLVRHLASALAGVLIAKGIGDQAMWELVTGALASIATLYWSYKDKTADTSQLDGVLRQVFTIAGSFFSWLTPSASEAIVGVLVALASTYLGFKVKSEPAQ